MLDEKTRRPQAPSQQSLTRLMARLQRKDSDCYFVSSRQTGDTHGRRDTTVPPPPTSFGVCRTETWRNAMSAAIAARSITPTRKSLWALSLGSASAFYSAAMRSNRAEGLRRCPRVISKCTGRRKTVRDARRVRKLCARSFWKGCSPSIPSQRGAKCNRCIVRVWKQNASARAWKASKPSCFRGMIFRGRRLHSRAAGVIGYFALRRTRSAAVPRHVLHQHRRLK